MLRIGVVADTHVTSFDEIPNRVLTALTQVDMIIHAGDFTTKDVLNGLSQLGEVKAVRGNMDSSELKQLLLEKELITVEGKTIGITHGSGSPWGIEERVGRMFKGVDIDVIVFGHSHQPKNKIIDGILFFNPGQARSSFGILTVGEEVWGEIIEV